MKAVWVFHPDECKRCWEERVSCGHHWVLSLLPSTMKGSSIKPWEMTTPQFGASQAQNGKLVKLWSLWLIQYVVFWLSSLKWKEFSLNVWGTQRWILTANGVKKPSPCLYKVSRCSYLHYNQSEFPVTHGWERFTVMSLALHWKCCPRLTLRKSEQRKIWQ